MLNELLQIDPTQAITVAKELGAGSAQTILAFVAVFATIGFGGSTVWLGRKLFTEIKSCSAERLDLMLKKIESDNKLASAIEGSNQVNRAALDALRVK